MVMLGTILRFVFGWLDELIFGAIEMIYEFFMMIAGTNLFSDDIIKAFGARIYALLGIIMLFKISFSLVNYIINPMKMEDKTQGGSKLVINIMVVIGLLASTPAIFSAIYGLQNIVLKEDVIGKVILGASGGDTNATYMSAGRIMSFNVFTAFYTPIIPSCEGDYTGNDPDVESEIPDDCVAALNDISPGVGGTYKDAYTEKSISKLLDSSLSNLTTTFNGEKQFVFQYTPIFSTIAGGFIAWILLIFCIDIAVRSVKLGFYQLIAPIPIISYIDPKSGQSGTFHKWVKEVLSTFLSIFIRLAAIYFAIFIITNLGSMETFDGAPQPNLFVKVFIILGALLFAKQLPQLIQDLTGLKLDGGGFSLNPIKKMGSVPLVGGLAAAGMTYAGNAGIGAAQGSLGLMNAGFKAIRGDTAGANDKLTQTKNRFAQRMDYSTTAAGQRFRSAGFAGSDKLSAESPGQVMAKERAEKRKTASVGHKSNLEMELMYNKGKRLHNQLQTAQETAQEENPNAKIEDSTIFKAEPYKKSYKQVSDAKTTMYQAKNAAAVAQSNYSAAASRGDEEKMETYKAEYTNYTELAGKAEARHSYLKTKHDNVKKQYQDDAAKEDALNAYRKISKEVKVPDSFDDINRAKTKGATEPPSVNTTSTSVPTNTTKNRNIDDK